MGASESCSSKSWAEVLLRHVHLVVPPLTTVMDLDKLWVEVDVPREPREWARLVEAMELLELLARVDHRAAWGMLLESTGNHKLAPQYEQILLGSNIVLPRYQLQLTDGHFDSLHDVTETLIRLVSQQRGHPKPPPSRQYARVKEFLLAVWMKMHNRPALDRETEGRVTLSLFMEIDEVSDDDAMAKRFQLLQTLAHTSNGKRRSAAGKQTRGVFKLHSFQVHFTSEHPMGDRALQLLRDVSDSPAYITDLRLPVLSPAALLPHAIGGFVRTQLGFQRGGSNGSAAGLDKLQLDLKLLNETGVQAFCTGIAHSRSLREVAISEDELETPITDGAARIVWWPWLVYALFSRAATHDIHTVSVIGLRLEPAQVQALRKVLDHADPLSLLLHLQTPPTSLATSPPNQDDGRHHPVVSYASLQPTAQLHLGHSHGERTGLDEQLVQGGERESYYVVRNIAGENFVEVLVPGFGVCWTSRAEVVEIKPVPPRTVSSVRHLKFDAVDDDMIHAVTDLLQLVGGSISRLSIEDVEPTLGDAFFHSVAASCPDLVRLDLKGVPLERVDWSWCPPSGDWKLQTLCLESTGLDEPLSWVRLFATLADPSHPFSQSLQQLHINFGGLMADLDDAVQDQIFSAVLAMLVSNFRLQRCELLDCALDAVTKNKELFLAHHNEPIAGKEAPLSSAETLAFLSVITPKQAALLKPKKQKTVGDEALRTTDTTTAQHNLDVDTVQLILAFAATSKRRVCIISGL